MGIVPNGHPLPTFQPVIAKMLPATDSDARGLGDRKKMKNKTSYIKYVFREILPVKYKETKKKYLRSVSIMRKAKGMSTENLFPLPFSLSTSVDAQLLYIVTHKFFIPPSPEVSGTEHFSFNLPHLLISLSLNVIATLIAKKWHPL